MSIESIPPGKHIARTEDGDYAAFYDGQILGYRRTRPEAEALCDEYVYNLFLHGNAVLAGDLAPAGGAE